MKTEELTDELLHQFNKKPRSENNLTANAIDALIKKFKSHWCKEQRGYCANIFVPNLANIMKKSTQNNTLPYEIKMAIQNANEPQ